MKVLILGIVLIVYDKADYMSETGQDVEQQKKKDGRISAGDYILIELKTGGTMKGTLVDYNLKEDSYSVTILLQREKLQGYMALGSNIIDHIVRLEKDKLDLGTVKKKREQFISESQQNYKKRLSEMEVELKRREEVRKQKQKELEEANKSAESPPSEALTEELKSLLDKFSPENGYGESKYNEYKRYWIKTNKSPPYLDLRTNAPPPQKEIEFYDNYSLWSYARSLTNEKSSQVKKEETEKEEY